MGDPENNTASEQPAPAQRPGVSIDWSSAEVEGGALVVELRGTPPKGWVKRTEELLGLLGERGGWGEVSVSKRKLKARDVDEGAEEALRHLFESAVMQANVDFDRDTDSPDPDEDDPQAAADRRLTRAFRAFADRESDA